MKASISWVLLTFLAVATTSHAQALREADRTRLAEAFQLAEELQDSLWVGWSQAPFAVLLLTPDHEFLIRHPAPTSEFASLGRDALLKSEVFARPASKRFLPGMLATFPAVGGVPTIVIGLPEKTGKSSTVWVISLLHEHFHQHQYSQPDYYDAVAALDLAGDDKSGMWMLNYPFPYDTTSVAEKHRAYVAALRRALQAVGKPEGGASLQEFLAARRALRGALTEPQYRYMSFQLWQEGVSRYTEYRVAELAARHRKPMKEFRELPDYLSYAAASDTLRGAFEVELSEVDLPTFERVAFYSTGAAEALLLDAFVPGWRRRYFEKKFDLEPLFEGP